MTAVIALLGALVAGGLVLVAAGLSKRVVQPSTSRSGPSLRQRLNPAATRVRSWGPRLVLGLIGGIGLAALTGLPLLVALVPLAAIGLPALLGQPANRDIDLLQALDRWVRGLTATLPTGRSITDAIRVSARQAPASLATSLHLLVARLDDRWSPQQALFTMADELDSPDADAVLAALALAAQRGGTGATVTLSALADSIQDRLKALREIETERSKPRAVVKQVTLITASVLAIALVIGRDFFAPYGTPEGQIILAGLLAAYIASLVVLRRMTLPRQRERIVRATS